MIELPKHAHDLRLDVDLGTQLVEGPVAVNDPQAADDGFQGLVVGQLKMLAPELAHLPQRRSDLSIEAGRRQEGRGGLDPQSQRDLLSERTIVAGTQQAAAREGREAAAAVEAARVLMEAPSQPLPNALIQTDALAKLKAEQENLLREVDEDRAASESVKGQRIR